MTDRLPDEQLWAGIQRALESYCSCSETITYCLERGGPYVEGRLLQLLIDCAEICQVTAGFLLRGSALHQQVNITCAEACEQCAQSCEQIDDDVLRQCADVCRRCADLCRQLAEANPGMARSSNSRPGIAGRLT